MIKYLNSSKCQLVCIHFGINPKKEEEKSFTHPTQTCMGIPKFLTSTFPPNSSFWWSGNLAVIFWSFVFFQQTIQWFSKPTQLCFSLSFHCCTKETSEKKSKHYNTDTFMLCLQYKEIKDFSVTSYITFSQP